MLSIGKIFCYFFSFLKLKYLFPIKKSELKLFLPIAFLMFFILFNSSIFRSLKDTLIIAEKNSGAEVVNFLKTFVVVPLSLLFVYIYSKACNVLSRNKIFYIVILCFSVFFLSFALYLYPNREFLHPSNNTILFLKSNYPRLKWLIPIYGLWTYSIFYSMADLWCSMCLSLLFWQFINQIISKEESRRFYGSFTIIGYIGLILAGRFTNFSFSNCSESLFDKKLKYVLLFTCICNLFIMICYYYASRNTNYKEVKIPHKKSKMSIIESFKIIFQQKQIMYIMILVFCYNFSINIVETTWKAELKKFTTSKSEFISYLGFISQIIGYTTIVFALLSNILLQYSRWIVCAMITPAIAFITSFIFFGSLGLQCIGIQHIFGISIMLICVLMGTAHNIFSKSGKYVFFDQTKEMSYISLDQDTKTKGKAAVDVTGSRLSKSLSGQVQALLLIIIPNSSQLSIFPYLSIILLFIFILWFWAVKKLSKHI